MVTADRLCRPGGVATWGDAFMLVGSLSNTDEEAVPNSLLKYYDNAAAGANFTFLQFVNDTFFQ